MSQAKFVLNSIPTQKGGCCEALLLPLMHRIEELENKLSGEIERREKDYNELLRLVVKEKIQTMGGKNGQSFVSIKERKSKVQNRLERSPQIINKKQAIKHVLNRRVSTKTLPVLKDSQLILLKKDAEAKTNDSILAIEERTKHIEQGIQHQQGELDKMKELNEYLMDQMLVIFEKLKQLEIKEQATAKQIESLETISSMVVEGETRQEHIKIINNLNNPRKADLPAFQLSDLMSKVAEHENVLSELIQLTREVSSQIGVSPKKQPQQL